jgi:hypothetical protein
MVAHWNACRESRTAIGWFCRRIDAFAIETEFPAVKNAAQAVALVPRQRQRGATVRTALREKADAAVGTAERHEILAEKTHALRRAFRFQFCRPACRNPILA